MVLWPTNFLQHLKKYFLVRWSILREKERFSFFNIFETQWSYSSKCFFWKYGWPSLGLWRRETFGGYGYRTDLAAYDEIKKVIDSEITTLELANARFYHLDTCLSIINKSTALFVPSAFSKETQQVLQQHFSQLIEVDEQEALEFLACNAHCPDGENIIIEEGATKLQAHCQKIGLNVYTADTSEFLNPVDRFFALKIKGGFNQILLKIIAWN